MTTFLLIRHGETDAVGKSMMGWKPGWRLNPAGKHQVDRLSAKLAGLPVKAVYTSPLERAVETASAVAAPHGVTVEKVDELGEVHLGEWEGLTIAELDRREEWRRFNTYRSGTRIPAGELMIETQTRMVRQLDRLAAQHPDATLAVVSHGDPLRSVIAYYLGIPLDLLLRFEVSPASVSILEAAQWGPRILCLNHTGEGPL
jgi:broad specificity phosphatase PhoE